MQVLASSDGEGLRRVLDQGLQAMQLDAQLDEQARLRLLQYLAELLRWNKVHNLSAIHDAEIALHRHLLDSLALLSYLPPVRPVYDIGSGAGLPGIPMAIVRPQQPFVLVEPAGKRVAFLRHVLLLLGLENVDVLPTRAETLSCVPEMVLVSRATAELADFLSLLQGCLRPGVSLLLAKGPAWSAEMERLAPIWAERFRVHPLRVPHQPPRFVLCADIESEDGQITGRATSQSVSLERRGTES